MKALIASTLFFVCAAAYAQRQPETATTVLDYEMEQARQQCRDAPFKVAVVDAVKKGTGNTHALAVISCLSSKNGRLITLVCDRADKNCKTITSRGPTSDAVEEDLLQLEKLSNKDRT